MSGYENVVGGKLKLKGKALDVKAGSLKKKKKKHVKKQVDSSDLVIHNELSTGLGFFLFFLKIPSLLISCL